MANVKYKFSAILQKNHQILTLTLILALSKNEILHN